MITVLEPRTPTGYHSLPRQCPQVCHGYAILRVIGRAIEPSSASSCVVGELENESGSVPGQAVRQKRFRSLRRVVMI